MTRYAYTPGGILRLRQRLCQARLAYKNVCDSNPEAMEAGDSSVWHDNFAYEENQRQMHMLARRVRDLRQMMEAVEVVPLPVAPPQAVSIGTRVRFVDDLGRERTVWIAGYDDGDPSSGRLSYNSPLARALLNASEGDQRELQLGGGRRTLEVIEISPAEQEDDRWLEQEVDR